MGTVYRETYTKPLPADAVVITRKDERFAKWIDSKGRKHRGWLAELEKVKEESETDEYMAGLAIKKERLKAYDELAQMAIEKIKASFPNITAKTASDVKALLSEVRELGRLIAMEQGSLHSGGQTIVAVKNDITIEELSQRYRNAAVEVVGPNDSDRR